MYRLQGFGIALKLTFAGNNQLTHAPTYLFGFVVVFCILIQMVNSSRYRHRHSLNCPFIWQNYFNKALDTFSTNV